MRGAHIVFFQGHPWTFCMPDKPEWWFFLGLFFHFCEQLVTAASVTACLSFLPLSTYYFLNHAHTCIILKNQTGAVVLMGGRNSSDTIHSFHHSWWLLELTSQIRFGCFPVWTILLSPSPVTWAGGVQNQVSWNRMKVFLFHLGFQDVHVGWSVPCPLWVLSLTHPLRRLCVERAGIWFCRVLNKYYLSGGICSAKLLDACQKCSGLPEKLGTEWNITIS